MALGGWISILLIVMVTSSYNKGANALDPHSAIPRGTVKTIETEYGEVVDCVDIYQQPSLITNPLLKNHQLQLRPSSISRGIKLEDENSSLLEMVQTWSCPQGTVPIHRPSKNDSTATNLRIIRSSNVSSYSNDQGTHKYAAIIHKSTSVNIHGVSAAINVWNPSVEAKDLSIAQFWINHDLGTGQVQESLEAGWLVNPGGGDGETRLFIFYTNDGYKTPCYNLDCGGFVLTDSRFPLGALVLKPYSVYNGDQKEITIAIVKDSGTQHWWFYYQGQAVGYWPVSLFKGLSTAANRVEWGGEMVQPATSTRPSTTQMGSGRFAVEGRAKAAYIRNLFYLDAQHKQVIPSPISYQVTNPLCYSITTLETDTSGAFFYFGGPGGSSSTCT